MRLSSTFSALSWTVLAASVLVITASPVAVANYLITENEFRYWLANTDANLTFIGAPINALAPRSALNTQVTYCSSRIDNLCGGACTVYNGGATCLNAPNTKCLAATHNVGFCDRGGCKHSCNQLSTCGTRLDSNFCYTPGTKSTLVGTA